MMDQDHVVQACSGPEIVQQGLRLTIQRTTGEDVQHFAATYQWIDFQNEPTLPDRPLRLLLADESTTFRHISIYHLKPGDSEHLTQLVLNCQRNQAVGVVLVHTSDDLPIPGQNLPPCDDVKIPVVLVTRKVGQNLLTELQDTSKLLWVAILTESSTDCVAPDYQLPNESKPIAISAPAITSPAITSPASPQESSPVAATSDEKPRLRDILIMPPSTEKFHLTQKMKKLLYEGSKKQPAVMCQDVDRICGTFELLDKYERLINWGVSSSKVKEKVTKACGLLKKSMEKNYKFDFPYHCLTVLRLQLHSPWRDLDAVVSYGDSCVGRLRTLTAHSMETVFIPFLEKKLFISWSGKKENTVALLLDFFRDMYNTQHFKRKCGSIEDFGTSLVIAELMLAVQQSLGIKDNATWFWNAFIKRLNPDELLWSQGLLNEMKQKLDLGSSLGLQLSMRFGCTNLEAFIKQYHLRSLEKIWQTIVTVYPSLPTETRTRQVMAAATREYLQSVMKTAGSSDLMLYSSPGDLRSFVETGRELVTFFHMHDYNTSSDVAASNLPHKFEIAKWIELILMSPFPGIAHHNWADHVKTLKQGTPQPLADIIDNMVIELVGKNLKQVSPSLFHEILIKLCFIPEETAGEFFKKYKARPEDSLKDPVWQKLFKTVLEREWDSLKPDILALVRDIGQVQTQQNATLSFFIDVLTLAQPQNCPLLLSDKDDLLLTSFKEFLLNLLEHMKDSLQQNLQAVLDVLGIRDLESPMRDAVLDVYSQIVIPTSQDLLKCQWSHPNWKFIFALSNKLCKLGKQMGPSLLLKSDMRSSICWSLLVKCCQCILPSQFKLVDPPKLMVFGCILSEFPQFWSQPAPGASLVPIQIQTNPEAVLTAEMQQYLNWYNKVRKWLHDVRHQVIDGQITTSELWQFKENYSDMEKLYESFMCSSFLLTLDDIESKISDLKAEARDLARCLIYHDPGAQKPVHMKELLEKWVVQIDQSLFQSIEKCVRVVENCSSETKEKKTECLLAFKTDVSLRQSKDLHDQTTSWLVPIRDNIDFLFYFSAHESILFQAYLETELEEIRKTLSADPHSGEESNQSCSEGLSLETFNKALVKTYQCVRQLLDCTAVFQHVSVIGQDRFKGVSVGAELATVVKYRDFVMYNVESVHNSISDMLSLVEYLSMIETIANTCSQLQLTACMSDEKFKELQKHGATNMKELTIGESSQLKGTLDQLLLNIPVDKLLHLFEAVQHSDEFFMFIRKNKFYTSEGKDSFFQQVGLITNQLQDQEYNETVLSHLRVAFQCIVPFTDPAVSFVGLLMQLKKSDVFSIVNWTHPVFTVNSNITTIKVWFSKAEGDTIENVTRDLQAILESGQYEFTLGQTPADSKGDTALITSDVPEKCHFHLVYVLETNTVHQQTNNSNGNNGIQQLLTGSKTAGTSLLIHPELTVGDHSLSEQVRGLEQRLGVGVGTQVPAPVVQTETVKLTRQLAGEELDDFIRKLGFIQGEHDDHRQSQIRKVLRINDMMQDMFEICSKLYKLGHPQYRNTKLLYRVSDSTASREAKVKKCYMDLKAWQENIRDLQKAYKELLFFSVQRILALSEALFCRDLNKVTSIVSALFSNSQQCFAVLNDIVSHCYANMHIIQCKTSDCYPFEICGKFLDMVVKDPVAVNHLYPKRRLLAESAMQKGHTVHIAHSFSPDEVFRLLLKIYQGLPESFEVMRCTPVTLKEELDLFLQRAVIIWDRTFVLINVNQLSTDLWEQILRFQLDKSTSESVRIHYIMTEQSIFYTAPWIKVLQYEDQDPGIPVEEAMEICRQRILKDSGIKEVQLVYGRAGDGKSHYIKKQMESFRGGKCTIAVHEAFGIQQTIHKLQQMSLKHANCVYFNVTVSPVSDPKSVEAQQYKTLMNTFYWFLFDLFGLGFVQDPSTGHSFRLRTGKGWQVYIEIPSVAGQDEAKAALALFEDSVPCLRYIDTKHHVKANDPLDVDEDTQLVCKYLKALEDGKRINRLYKRRKEVKFSIDPDVKREECHRLLHGKMGDHVKIQKIMQQLFVKYMKRRCNVLENAPGFNYNVGRGEYITDQRTSVRTMTDTKELGSTLLSAMLKEVNNFCNPKIQEDWKHHAHQQLVYDFKNGSASFLFLSLNPDKLSHGEREKLEKIGIEIPPIDQLNSREMLDRYLSSALNIDLEHIQTSSDSTNQYRLSVIDKERYVLTVDYAVKMLDIHERRMCGVPVVIEGETGVGKTALVRMLSLLWNESLERSRRIALGRISELLQGRAGTAFPSDDLTSRLQPEDVNAANRVACCINTGERPIPADVNKVCAVQWQDIRKVLLEAIDEPSMYMFDIDKGLVVEAKSKSSSESTARLLGAFLTVKQLDTFYKLSAHAALTPKDIIDFFTPKFQQANELLQLTAERGGKQPPTVVIFLDEINTSSCMGLFKELLVDRSLDGTPIPSNVFLVAACNPHRGSSVAIRSCSERDDWVLGSYYVHPLPPTLQFLSWDYGALDENQERDYIQQKMTMDSGRLSIQVLQYSTLIAHCQHMVREFACHQLRRVGFAPDEAVRRAKSCVSQRDIQRVFTLAAYFEKSFNKDFPTRDDDKVRRSILVSLGIVYYLRLDDSYRKEFCEKLKSLEAGTCENSFEEVFKEEIDFYVEKMHIPVGIAKTRTLKENLFASVICTACRLPLIIVGAPGSSKTLSFNLALANLKGAESRESFFRDTKRFPALDPFHYQCSRRSTSLEIENVFKRAIKRQQNHNSSKLPINCVVFMDEAGLPEESHESLKVLHYYLDDPSVSFVAITNHILDASKSNRAISLFRPKADEEDLKTLARGCLCTDPANPPAKLRNIVSVIDKFCSAYARVMRVKRFRNFFGLRDFIHFIGYIRRHHGSSTEHTPDLVLKAVERNFNGIDSENFQFIANTFLSKISHSLTSVKPRNTIEVLRESLAEPSLAESRDNDGVEAEVRYKLIIDTSEDDSMARLLFMHKVLDQSSTRTFTCSDFPDDGDIQKVHIISAIKHAAMEGKTVILRQTDDINESFYDLFNQHFRRIDDPNFEGGRRYYANIAIGSHSKPCRVDPKFQCIVHMHQSEIKGAPPPFLNRFEKFLVSQDDLLQITLDARPSSVNKIVSVAMSKGRSFYETLGQEHMYGATEQTLQSLFLELLPLSKDLQLRYHQCLEATIEKKRVSEESQDDNDEEDSYPVINEVLWNKKAPIIIEVLEDTLKDMLGFQFIKKSTEQRQFQTKAIFSAALQLFDEHDGTACRNELLRNPEQIVFWLVEGLVHLESSQITVPATKRITDSWQYVESITTRNASFAIAVLVQWIVFHVCSSLLKITTPECLILKREQIPKQYVLEYLSEQPHFSLKEVVQQAYKVSSHHGSAISKMICFTRTTSVVHRLPPSIPASTLTGVDSHAIQTVEQLLPHGLTNGLVMLKLESIRTLEAFSNILQEFMESNANYLFLIIANMQNCSQRRINHVRSMIEERELAGKSNMGVKKHFVILLHFPPSLGHTKPCYPTLFLHGWEHIYLDSIDAGEDMDPVDVCQWMRISCAKAQVDHESEDSFASTELKRFPVQLREGLVQVLPQAVNAAVSRIMFGDYKKCHLNRRMDARKREEMLLQMLHENPDFSEALCEKFARAWNIDAIIDQLLMAAQYQSKQDSCLTVSDQIQSRFRTLFYSYVSQTFFWLNKELNLEILFGPFDSDSEAIAVKNLLVEIFKLLPSPELNELRLLNHTFDARWPARHVQQSPVFPFFSLVAQEIEQALDSILMGINREVASSFEVVSTEETPSGTEELEQMKDIRLDEIEDRAARQLLQLLKSPEDNSHLHIAQLASQAINANQQLWERYLADFARVKLQCYLGQHGSQEHRLLSAWLHVLDTYTAEQRLVVLHIIARLRPKSISFALAALRPLESLESLHPDIMPSNVRLMTHSGQELEGHLYAYIIKVMYGYLENMLSSPREQYLSSLCDDSFVKWCIVYQNLSDSLSGMRLYHSEDVYVRSKLQAIHVVFLFMRALSFDKSVCAVAMNLARDVIHTYNAQVESIRQSSSDFHSLPLRSVIESGLSCLHQAFQVELGETPGLGIKDAFLNSESSFVEDVLAFYFPTRGFSMFCSLSDCYWLMKMINSQSHWCVENVQESTIGDQSRRVSVTAGDDFPVGLVHFKIVQDSLNQLLQIEFDVDQKTGFSSTIRQMIGEVLCECSSTTDISPFIPACYPNASKTRSSLVCQPLSSVYFHCCLKQLNVKLGGAEFSYVLGLMEQYHVEIQSADIPDLAVLQIERQAVMQVVIRKFSEMFNPGNVEMLKPYLNEYVIRQVNLLVEDERFGGGGKDSGHVLTFLHHLSQRLKSTRSLISIFTDHSNALCSPFPWMKGIVDALKEKPVVQSHLFSFMMNDSSEQTFQSVLYKKMSSLVADVAKAAVRRCEEDETKAVDTLCAYCKSEASEGEGKILHLRMMLWLAVYYQLYEQKVPSECVAEAVYHKLDCLGLNLHQEHLLACFAVPQRMVRCCEPSNPINPDAVRLEIHGGKARRRAQPRDKATTGVDPVWDLFCPSNIDEQDPSDTDLRRALALLAAVVMGLPARSTHLWTHIFEPDAIEGTYVTGNMYRNAVKSDGLLYDCGCELTADGDYGRADYASQAQRGTLNLHSLYLLLWVNFGGFCLSLLTQPGAQNIIKGHVISEWQSVRHYCLSQLQTMWLLMRNNFKFSDEERTFFVTSALHKLLEVAQKTNSPLRGHVFTDPGDLDVYERTFHTEVLQPTFQMFENKSVIDDKIWRQHSLLTSLRTFSATYPEEPTYRDFLHSLEHIQGAGHLDLSQQLSVLCKFVREKQLLRIGGLLLPDLVEFYLWLHQQLSHLITMEQAVCLTIGDVVERITNRYSKSYSEYIQRLFVRVQENYNKYVEMSGGYIGYGACLRVRKENELRPIDPKETKLAQLLSDTEEEGESPDALFTVIRTLVTAHNDFVQAVRTDDSVTTATSRNSRLPSDKGEVNASELGWHNCLMGDITPSELQPYLNREVDCLGDEPGVELMKIICRHYLYMPGAGVREESRVTATDLTASLLARYSFKPSSMFKFHRLQKDVVTQFIAGKPFINDPAQIRIFFRYRKEQTMQVHPTLRSSDIAEAHIDLPTLEQELPDQFKNELSSDKRKLMDIVFHNLNYRDSVDLIKAIRGVAGHLCQAVMEAREISKDAVSKKCEELAQLTIKDFLLHVYNETSWSADLETRLGLPRLADRQREELLQTYLSQIYQTLSTFVTKLCNHEYEFAHLPLTLKTPLSEIGKDSINKLPVAYSERHQRSSAVESLRQFDKTLLHSERFLEQEAKKNLCIYLVENKFYDATDLPVCCLSDDVRVEHYMHVRLAVQRVVSDVQARGIVSFAGADLQEWSDVVTALVEEFSQLDHRPRPELAASSKQIPVMMMGEKWGLHHPLWFEQAADKQNKLLTSGQSEVKSVDNGDEESDIEPVEENDYFSNEESFNNADLTLRPIEVTLQPDQLSNTVEEAEDSVKTLDSEWEYIQETEESIDNRTSDGGKIPIWEQTTKHEKMQLQESAVESVSSPLSGSMDVSKLLAMCSPEAKESLQRQLLCQAGKDLSFMSVDDVVQFLETNGFAQYVNCFKEHNIDGGDLQELDVDGLKDMGVKALHASKIIKLVKKEKRK